MSDVEIIKKYLSEYSKNELIFASKLYKEKMFDLVSEASYYKTLERMVKDNKLEKLSKGVYYFTKMTEFGKSLVGEKQIVNTFISQKKGMVVGYYLFNRLNLTTQIANIITIYSSFPENENKTLKRVKIKKIEMKFNDSVIYQIEFLEVLQNYKCIENFDYTSFINFIKKYVNYYDDKITKNVLEKIKYKKSTIAFLHYILNYFKIENSLSKYLSSLSKYNYPRMEELYEIAREQRKVRRIGY